MNTLLKPFPKTRRAKHEILNPRRYKGGGPAKSLKDKDEHRPSTVYGGLWFWGFTAFGFRV